MQSSPSNDGKGTWECGIGETVPSCSTYGVADLLRCGEGRGMGFRLWVWSWSHGCWQGVIWARIRLRLSRGVGVAATGRVSVGRGVGRKCIQGSGVRESRGVGVEYSSWAV